MKESNIPKEYPINSEGEEFIYDYLYKEDFTFVHQSKIDDLKGDTKSYRVADFYIPRINLYIEFLGLWNVNDESRRNYQEKKKLYAQNKIPCVYIYPENLGVLSFVFKRRAIQELLKYGMKKELRRFRFSLYHNALVKNWNLFQVYFYLGIALLYFFENKDVYIFAIPLFLLSLKQADNLVRGYFYYFKKLGVHSDD